MIWLGKKEKGMKHPPRQSVVSTHSELGWFTFLISGKHKWDLEKCWADPEAATTAPTLGTHHRNVAGTKGNP